MPFGQQPDKDRFSTNIQLIYGGKITILSLARGDLTINSGINVSTTTAGPVVTLNSDNTVSNDGNISIEDVDGATAVDIQGGNTGSYTQTGNISLIEDYTPEDTDGDRVPDQPLALGTGRTGILISTRPRAH